MSGRVRTAARWGVIATLALLLTGCLKLNMNLGINSDDTVNGRIQFGIQKELLELTGQTPEDLLGTDAPFPSDAPGVTVEPFDDGEFAGQQFTFESLPIEQFNSQEDGDALNIQRQGDSFVVTGVLDLSSGLTGGTGAFGATGQELFESADIRISITFPGDVIDANGQVDGNTVTYLPTFGERLEISATGSAIDDGDAGDVVGAGGDSNLLLILIIAAAVILVLVVVYLVMRSRRGPGGGDATGFGEAGPAAVPGTGMPAGTQAGTPPAAPTPPATPTPPAVPPMPPAAPPPPPAEG